MNTRTPRVIYRRERQLFYIAMAILLVSFCGYIYFVSASVTHVVMRKETDKQIAALGSEVSTLEANYIEAQHSVSTEIATQHGFTANNEKIFIGRSNGALVLSR